MTNTLDIVSKISGLLPKKCDYFYLGNERAMLSIKDKGMLVLPTNDLSVSAVLMNNCEWEVHETDLIIDILNSKNSQNWIEVGANVGYYTIMIGNMLRDKQNSFLYAFEASPKLHGFVHDSILLNSLQNTITLYNNAVWNVDGERIAFKEFDKQMGGSHVVQDEAIRPDIKSIYVDTVTLDRTITEHKSIDILKMDIEGAECAALQGAKSILHQSDKLSIIMEWNISMQKQISIIDPKECLNYISSFGFNQFYIINSADGNLIETDTNDLSTTSHHLDLLIQKSDMGITYDL